MSYKYIVRNPRARHADGLAGRLMGLASQRPALAFTAVLATGALLGTGASAGIGLASAMRVSAVPNVPTYGEMGFPDFHSGSWVGFFAPAKTPDAVVAKLNAEINQIMKEPDVQEKLKAIGFEAIVKNQAETVDYFRSEIANWGKMTRAIGFSN